MKRRTSIGGLVGVVLLLTVGGIVFLLVPARPCPWCVGITAPLKAPLAKPTLHCPVCLDRGRVSLMRFRNAEVLHPAVADLARTQRQASEFNPIPALELLVKGRGEDSNVVLGRKYFSNLRPEGRVSFVEEGGRSFALVLIHPRTLMGGEEDWRSAILLGIDGSVRDFVHLVCNSPTGSLDAQLLDWLGPDGEWATLSVNSQIPEFPATVEFYDRTGWLASERCPAPARRSTGKRIYALGVRSGRFAFLP